ncbi:MAG: vWA domain-containing protein [Pirellulales bacterium]
MSYGNTRRPYRKKKDNTPVVLAIITLLALPALGFAVYKFVINKPAVTDEDVALELVPEHNSTATTTAVRPTVPTAAPNSTPRTTTTSVPSTTPANTGPSDPFAMADMMGMMNADVATAKVCKKLKESMELRKTLAIWLFDRSPSADGRREDVLKNLKTYYPLLKIPGQAPAADPANAQLVSVVGAFASGASFITAEPEADTEKFLNAVGEIKSGTDGNIENTFKAIEAAVEKFGTYAEPPHLRNVAVIIVTDEIGNDQAERDKVTQLVQKSTIPVYVIGAAAPFGSTGAMSAGAEGSQFAQGPESRDLEWVNIDSGMGPIMMGNQETNLGPYGLSAEPRVGGRNVRHRQPRRRHDAAAAVHAAVHE